LKVESDALNVVEVLNRACELTEGKGLTHNQLKVYKVYKVYKVAIFYQNQLND